MRSLRIFWQADIVEPWLRGPIHALGHYVELALSSFMLYCWLRECCRPNWPLIVITIGGVIALWIRVIIEDSENLLDLGSELHQLDDLGDVDGAEAAVHDRAGKPDLRKSKYTLVRY